MRNPIRRRWFGFVTLTLLAIIALGSYYLRTTNKMATGTTPAAGINNTQQQSNDSPLSTQLISPLTLTVTTVPPRPTPTATPFSPPVLVRQNLRDGQRWGGEPVILTFDQPIAAHSTDYFSVSPHLPGQTYIDHDRLIFEADQAPQVGRRYRFQLTTNAQSTVGQALDHPVSFDLTGANTFWVTASQPAAGAVDISVDLEQITLMFNRPVVPLVGIDALATLPQPLTVEPAIAGEGEWLNTSVYRFTLAERLASSTTYTGTVAPFSGLQADELAGPYHFSFTTTEPTIVGISPSGTRIAPDAVIDVRFSHPMEQPSTEAAFSLRRAGTTATVPGRFGWNELQTSFTFTPTTWLDFGETYIATMDQEARPAHGTGALRGSEEQQFTIVPLPLLVSTDPPAGVTHVNPDWRVQLNFNVPVSMTQVLAAVQVEPVQEPPTNLAPYQQYNERFTLPWQLVPQTTYTVTVGPGIADHYGNTIDTSHTFTFTTGDYDGFQALNLGGLVHFTTDTVPQVKITYRNVPTVDLELFRVPLVTFQEMVADDWRVWNEISATERRQHRVWLRNYPPQVARNEIGNQVVKLTGIEGNVLPSGLYLLEMDAPQYHDKFRLLIVLSNYNIVVKESTHGTSLAWLTDLRTGRPVSSQTLHLYRAHSRTKSDEIARGVTDLTGLAQFTLPTRSSAANWSGPLFAVSNQPGHELFAIAATTWSSGIGPWNFGLPTGYEAHQVRTHFYTERPLYRPGQTIHWKGIVRVLDGDTYTAPPVDLPVTIDVYDSQGQKILTEKLHTNEHGTINSAIPLAAEAPTGHYRLQARLEVQDPAGVPYTVNGGTQVQVASYRKPEFEIFAKAETPEVVQGETVRIRVQSNYFSGGPLAEGEVTWRILADPYTFNWRQQPTDESGQVRRYTFQPYIADYYSRHRYSSETTRVIGEGSGITDKDGGYVIAVQAALLEQDTGMPRSQRWRFEITVQSPTNQFVSTGSSTIVHSSELYIGLRPQRYVTRTGTEAAVDLVAVTYEQTVVADTAISATVYAVEWHSAYKRDGNGRYYWDSQVERTPVFTTTLVTDRAGTATLRWTPEAGGQYQIVARGADAAGRPTASMTFLWVSASSRYSRVSWPRSNNDRMELVADKDLYQPGDTAQILVPLPFSGPVEALLTIERGGVLESSVLTLESNSELIEIPITPHHLPNVYVSLTAVKGVDETNPVPAMAVGYLQLPIDVQSKALALEITTAAETLHPRETASYAITVTNHLGNPVPNAEVSVALVDKAVLSLSNATQPDLLDIFYRQRELGVRTGILLTINRDRQSQQVSEGTKGGGGGDGLEIRQDFPDIAFWRADLVTDQHGQIHLNIPLPDNLTTWQLVAHAISDDTLVGTATQEVIATQELQLRPLAPRFFTAGDRGTIGAVLINGSPWDAGTGQLRLDIEGARLISSTHTTDFTLDAGEQLRQLWPIEILSDTTQVLITMTAQTDSLADGVHFVLPVHAYQTPEIVGTTGVVNDKTRLEAITLPDAATATGELAVKLEASLAVGMVDGLTYLQHYPYECNEQTISRFLPNLFSQRALRTATDALGPQNVALADNLQKTVTFGVQRLVNRQNPDGGWGYWPTSLSNPFTTAYVLWGLHHADQMGHAVPAEIVDKAVDFLYRSFEAPHLAHSAWRLNEMAFLHFVLSEMGRGDPGRATTLYGVRERLHHYGRAYLVMALANLQEEDEFAGQIRTLLDDLTGAAKLTATGAFWQERSIDWWTYNTDTRTTSVVLAAFSRLEPEQPLLPQVVRWLMQARTVGRWRTTQENAWAIIGLTEWMTATGELKADYTWTVSLNGQQLGNGHYGPDNLRAPTQLRATVASLLRDAPNQLEIARDNTSGQLYYTAHLRYYLDALKVAPRDRGIVLDRQFAIDNEPVTTAQVGDIINVKTTIVAPTNLYHVLVEVPLPAGTEPLDTSLATTGEEAPDPRFNRTDRRYYWWGYWRPTYTNMRDEKVALFADYLPAGTYEYTFAVRATTPGEYRVLPAHAEEMYFPEVWGRSGGALFVVAE